MKSIFPTLDEIETEENLLGHLIKYNVTERLFYSPIQKTQLMKLYDFNTYKLNDYNVEKVKPVILRNKTLYMSIN